MSDIEYLLTTVDNPFNPHTHYDEWNAWDQAAGYHSASFLARVVHTSNDLPENLQDLAIQHGIDEIVKENVSGVHMKITAPNTS